MASTKLAVVLGATGIQGGSVVTTLLKDPTFLVRGVTRSIDSEKCKSLQDQGVEMVSANLDDPATLVEAFRGAKMIFSTTDYWGAFSDPANQKKASDTGDNPFKWTYEYELQQFKNVFDAAAKTEGLERLIVSSLSDASKWSKGKYKLVYHFDGKAHGVEYAKETYPEIWRKTSVIQVGWYLSNWLIQPTMTPKKGDDGTFTFYTGIPTDLKLPLIATEVDTGVFVKALIAAPPEKNLITYREWMSIGELATVWGKVLGVPTKSVYVPLDENDPAMAGPAQNMKYFEEFGYEGRDDPSLIHPRDLDTKVELGTVAEWVKAQDWSAILNP